jgi:hypothetical protein
VDEKERRFARLRAEREQLVFKTKIR